MRKLRTRLIQALVGADVELGSIALLESLRCANALPGMTQQSVIDQQVFNLVGLRRAFQIRVTGLIMNRPTGEQSK